MNTQTRSIPSAPCLACLLSLLCAIGAPAATNIAGTARSVTVNTNATVTSPTNFWAANSNSIAALTGFTVGVGSLLGVLSASNGVITSTTGPLPNSVSGNAATATIASNIVGILPIASGGTGNTTNRAATAVVSDTVSGPVTNLIVRPTTPTSSGFTLEATQASMNNGVVSVSGNSSSTGFYGLRPTAGVGLSLMSAYAMDFRVSDTNIAMAISAAGDVYCAYDVSALTFTDRSDAPANSVDAARMLASFAVSGGKVDHSKLDPSLWGSSTVRVETGRKLTNVVSAVKGPNNVILTPATTNIVDEMRQVVIADQSKRNLSMMVSALALDNQSKQKQIDALIARVTVLETR